MPRKPAPKRPPPKFTEDDDILDPDSEEDEFADYVASTRRPGITSDEEDGSEEGSEEGSEPGEFDSEDEGDGVGVYEADEWDAAADSESGSESEDEDAAKLVSCAPDTADASASSRRASTTSRSTRLCACRRAWE